MALTKGYHSYRGRNRTGRIVLIVVLCVVLLAAVGFLAIQRYAVYGTDGSIRFELPWAKKEAAEPGETGGTDVPQIVVEEPEKTGTEEVHAYALEENVLRGGAASALASLPEDANAVAVRVKNARGEVLYNSRLSAAIEAGTVAGSSVSGAAIEDLTASGYHTIACISALHDSIYSFAHMADAGILQIQHPGYIWYDPDSTFYLAPEKPLARQYLADIARECAELGFDELLFDSFGYPTGGRQNNIDVSQRTMTKSEAISLLAEELRRAVKDYDVKLSVALDEETVLAGGNDAAGIELSALAEWFDRVYVETTEEETANLAAALESYALELVPVLKETPAAGNRLLES